jgi:hypothetical protein
LGRPGLYVREMDSLVVFLAFKGNDIHSGFQPTVDESNTAEYSGYEQGSTEHLEHVRSGILEMWNLVGPERRVAYIPYFPRAACDRSCKLSINPPVVFGNGGAATGHKQMADLNYVEHGKPVLGDSYWNRLAWEFARMQWNLSLSVGLRPNDPNQTLMQTPYFDTSGTERYCHPFPFHPAHDVEHINYMRGVYQWRYNIIQEYSLNMRKAQLKRFKETTVLKIVDLPTKRPHIFPLPVISKPMQPSQEDDVEEHIRDIAPQSTTNYTSAQTSDEENNEPNTEMVSKVDIISGNKVIIVKESYTERRKATIKT